MNLPRGLSDADVVATLSLQVAKAVYNEVVVGIWPLIASAAKQPWL
jgi:hypothetical protein